MQFTLVLLSVLGLAIATPVDVFKVDDAVMFRATTRNSTLENLILGLLEDLRQTMLTGSDDVPILDPFELEQLNLNDQIVPLPGFHLDLKNLRVLKLATFIVNRLNINFATIIPVPFFYRIEFDFHVPVLEILADNYDLSLSAMGANIFGNGDASINLIDPRVSGTITVRPRITIGNGIFLQITSSTVNLSLDGFESRINGLMNDPAMSEFINTFLRHFVPELLVQYEDDITTVLSNTVQEVGNDILYDLNLASILG